MFSKWSLPLRGKKVLYFSCSDGRSASLPPGVNCSVCSGLAAPQIAGQCFLWVTAYFSGIFEHSDRLENLVLDCSSQGDDYFTQSTSCTGLLPDVLRSAFRLGQLILKADISLRALIVLDEVFHSFRFSTEIDALHQKLQVTRWGIFSWYL